MGKPQAARNRPVVLSDDSDGDYSDGSHSPPPKRPRRGALASRSRRVAAPTPKSPAKSPAKPKPASKPITSFFSSALRPHAPQPTPSPEKPALSPEEIDDILDSDDELSSKKPATLVVRKRGSSSRTAEKDRGSKGSHRFLRAGSGAPSTPPPSRPQSLDQEDRRPWTDKYGPASIDELAVHKKKVAEVSTWLSNVLGGRERKRLLLLKGPAGSGKTTAISLLSKELGFAVHEWKNPTGSVASSEGFVSATAQFEDFVGRAGKFGSLMLAEPALARQPVPSSTPSSIQNQLILVEEFPNTFARNSSVVQSFRSSVLNFLAANTPSATTFFSAKADPKHSITPIVMIISETLLSTNTAAADSFTAHRLLGPEIMNHPAVTSIDFNPIAPTFMTKALDLIVVKEAKKSGRKKTVGPQVIQRLAELGDIRSATSSLEFLCLRGDEADGWGAKVSFAKKKGLKDTPITKMEQESLEMITQRESTLGIFHSVGKIVYNKRISEDLNNPVAQPPNWFPERRRPKASEVNVDTLIDELGTDTQTFVAALHENYALSCGTGDSEETMDAIEGCMDALSDADLLTPDRIGNSGFGRRNFQGTSADTLRQDELCFQTSVRGLLYNLPNPVKRLTPPPGVMGTRAKGAGSKDGGGSCARRSAHSMYWPASLRIWRQQEEIGGLLDMWISRAQKGELLAATKTGSIGSTPPVAGGVDTWRKTRPPFQSSISTTATPKLPRANLSSEAESLPFVLLGSGGSARYEMLLERLPYLPLILRKFQLPMAPPSSSSSSISATIREIQKITSFLSTTTSSSSHDHDNDDVDNDALPAGEHEQWTTDKPGPETPQKRKKFVGIEKKVGKSGAAGTVEEEEVSLLRGAVEKEVKGLVLSDDDIED